MCCSPGSDCSLQLSTLQQLILKVSLALCWTTASDGHELVNDITASFVSSATCLSVTSASSARSRCRR